MREYSSIGTRNVRGHTLSYKVHLKSSRAEGDRVVGRVGAGAGPESGARRLVERVRVRVGASVLCYNVQFRLDKGVVAYVLK